MTVVTERGESLPHGSDLGPTQVVDATPQTRPSVKSFITAEGSTEGDMALRVSALEKELLVAYGRIEELVEVQILSFVTAQTLDSNSPLV